MFFTNLFKKESELDLLKKKYIEMNKLLKSEILLNSNHQIITISDKARKQK